MRYMSRASGIDCESVQSPLEMSALFFPEIVFEGSYEIYVKSLRNRLRKCPESIGNECTFFLFLEDCLKPLLKDHMTYMSRAFGIDCESVQSPLELSALFFFPLELSASFLFYI